MSAETLITAAPTDSRDHAAEARSRRTLRRRRNRKKAKAIRASEQTHPHHLALGWGERASEE